MKLIPRDEKFFDLLDQQANYALLASELLKEIVNHWQTKKSELKKLKEYEQECDITTHEIMNKINRTFVTPLDREDIHTLAKKLSSLVDLIQKVGSHLDLFSIEEPTADLKEMVSILHECTEVVLKATHQIRSLKNSLRILDYCVEISNLENIGDRALEKAVKNIFTQQTNPIEVIKWQEIYNFCEGATNSCESIAYVIEAIVVKYG